MSIVLDNAEVFAQEHLDEWEAQLERVKTRRAIDDAASVREHLD